MASKHFTIGKKVIEFEVINFGELFELSIRSNTKQDHPGFELELSLFRLSIQLHFYDIRHWNYEENRFYKNNEEIECYANLELTKEDLDEDHLNCKCNDIKK